MSDDAQCARVPDAWEWRACIGGRWGSWLYLNQPVEYFKDRNAFNIENGTYELRPLYAIPNVAAGALEPLSEEERLRKVLQNFADQMLTDEMELESSGDFEGAYDIMIKMARSALSSQERP